MELSHLSVGRGLVGRALPGRAFGSPTVVDRAGPAGGVGERPNRVATLRTALRVARVELARIRSHAEDMERQRNVAQAEAERWRLEYRYAVKAYETLTSRRDALVAALPAAVSAMSISARTAAWDEGWDAALGGELIRLQNPYRGAVDPAPTRTGR